MICTCIVKGKYSTSGKCLLQERVTKLATELLRVTNHQRICVQHLRYPTAPQMNPCSQLAVG